MTSDDECLKRMNLLEVGGATDADALSSSLLDEPPASVLFAGGARL
jgi:hypothetical protein